MDIQYNSWRTDFKQPFGAIEKGEKVNFKIKVDSLEEIQGVYLIVKKREQEIMEYRMNLSQHNQYSFHFHATSGSGLYYYCFRIDAINENHNPFSIYYGKKNKKGEGYQYTQKEEVEWYQLTCFSEIDESPDWFKEAVFYQIFPDRFFNGNDHQKINQPKPNTFIYGTYEDKPMYIRNDDGSINRWDFYGGNLKGITKKIPYFKKLGITALYLNPIFEGTSNHRYDTNDYFNIDPVLGTKEDFRTLVTELHKNEIKIILDGVFSHVGKDSRYFNYSGSYGTRKGAYRSQQSKYYDWFTFKEYPHTYESWWGITDLPVVNKGNTNYQEFIYGKDSVLDYWQNFDVDGWRLDVADELPNFFLEGIREKLNGFEEQILIGEVWEDASNKVAYGEEKEYASKSVLQSVMNYPLRDIIIDLVNETQALDKIVYELMNLKENYPKHFYESLFNNIGTHDTKRILTKCNGSIKKTELAFSLLFAMPGVPCIYYGDEAGLLGGKDPENRAFFPWHNPNEYLLNTCQSWIERRQKNVSLIHGDTHFFYHEDKHLFAILRQTKKEQTLSLFNFAQISKELPQADWKCENLAEKEIEMTLAGFMIPENIEAQSTLFLIR